MKVQLYPKTARLDNPVYTIVEKLDGSNLGFLKLNGELLIAQRNNVYKLSELNSLSKNVLYPKLEEFLKEYGLDLLARLHEGSGVFGEWLGTGRIKYEDISSKFAMFAKANILGVYGEELSVKNIMWDSELFMYSFIDKNIPDYISQPQEIAKLPNINIETLDKLYNEYLTKVERKVEGFVIMSPDGNITKYVRYKRGKLTPHKLPK